MMVLRYRYMMQESTNLSGILEDLINQSRKQAGKTSAKVQGDTDQLDALQLCLSEETPNILFDYFSMHKRCTRLLRQIFEEVDAEHKDSLKGFYVERNDR